LGAAFGSSVLFEVQVFKIGWQEQRSSLWHPRGSTGGQILSQAPSSASTPFDNRVTGPNVLAEIIRMEDQLD